MSIVIEPLNRYESNIINTVNEACKLAKKIDMQSIKILCDTFHMNIEEQSFEEAIRTAVDTIAHVHVADSNRKIPGKGHIKFEEPGI